MEEKRIAYKVLIGKSEDIGVQRRMILKLIEIQR
jgi:hypothetical protein